MYERGSKATLKCMEAILLLLLVLAVGWAVLHRSRTKRQPAPLDQRAALIPASRDDQLPPAAPLSDGDELPTFRVVALGLSGSGKTVFLSTMFHELSHLAPQRSYYLDVDGQTRLALGAIYNEVSDTSREWPHGTATTREFVFDCVGVDAHNSRHPVLRLSYLDYSGGLLERAEEPGSTAQSDLITHIEGADALLGMIDGHRLLAFMRGEQAGRDYFQRKLRPMLGFMHRATCPIHFVITKWDLVRDFGEPRDADDQLRLARVIDALLRYEHIKALVHSVGGHRIVRLIPVSAVGTRFAQLDRDGRVSKLPNGEMDPMHVDVPLCAVLPDVFSQAEHELDERSRRRLQRAMRAYLRSHRGSVLAQALRRPAIAAARTLLPGYGSAAAVLVLEWLSPDSPPSPAPDSIEREIATRQRVMDDFKRAVVRLEAVLPQSQLSGRW